MDARPPVTPAIEGLKAIIDRRRRDYSKAACDECDGCGEISMCSYHSLLSELIELEAEGQGHAATPAGERELCSTCGGNGVVKIPGGVSVCDRCKGDCWEPHHCPPAALDREALVKLAERWQANADMLAECNKSEHFDPLVGIQRACAEQLLALLRSAPVSEEP